MIEKEILKMYTLIHIAIYIYIKKKTAYALIKNCD